MQFLALPMLLESEIQYSTQEMMLEFVSRYGESQRFFSVLYDRSYCFLHNQNIFVLFEE
jgi:hypothetical protein